MKTTSKELSVTLKEAGFPQNTNYYWVYSISGGKDCKVDWKSVGAYKPSYAAPTAEEILEQYPDFILTPTGGAFSIKVVLHLSGTERQYEIHTEGLIYANKKDEVGFYSKHSLAEVAGQMYLYLAENHLLKEDTNEAQIKEGATS